MANRLVGNTYIIDSQTNAVGLSWLSNSFVNAVSFYATGTDGAMELASTLDTSNVLIRFGILNHTLSSVGTTSVISNQFNQPNTILLNGVRIDQLSVKTLVNGTGFIYFQ